MWLLSQRVVSLAVIIIWKSILIDGALADTTADVELKKPITSPREKLNESQKALDQAEKKAKSLKAKSLGLEKDIIEIRRDLIVTARAIQNHERRAVKLNKKIEELDATQLKIRESFKRRRIQLGAVLGALQRMARNPPESLIAQPATPADMVRSAILLRATLPRLEEEAARYRKDLNSLISARDQAAGEHQKFNQEMKKLGEQQARLGLLHGRKKRLRQQTIQETKQASHQAIILSKRTQSLRELLKQLNVLGDHTGQLNEVAPSRISKKSQKTVKSARVTDISRGKSRRKLAANEPPRGFSGRPFDTRKGLVPFPVVGRVAARYGQLIAKGRSHKGLTLETRKSAQVIAPYEGKVAFSGPFRSYGKLLIIEHTGGYHTLLAGMAHIDVGVGQWVLTGEPVAVMERNGIDKPLLYLEIRRNSQPINPLSWLMTRKGKISG